MGSLRAGSLPRLLCGPQAFAAEDLLEERAPVARAEEVDTSVEPALTEYDLASRGNGYDAQGRLGAGEGDWGRGGC